MKNYINSNFSYKYTKIKRIKVIGYNNSTEFYTYTERTLYTINLSVIEAFNIGSQK